MDANRVLKPRRFLKPTRFGVAIRKFLCQSRLFEKGTELEGDAIIAI